MPFGIAAAVAVGGGLAAAGVGTVAAIGAGLAVGVGVAGAVGSIEAGEATKSAEDTAAGYATQEEQITAMSTATQEMLANRKITQALGTETADTAGNGLAMSGSAAELMRSSIMQGGIQKSLIEQQGQVTELGYSAQAKADTATGAIAQSSGLTGAAGDLLGGGAKTLAAIG